MADPEIDAMAGVANALADLDQPARQRVIEWAAARYDVTINGAAPGQRAEDADGGGDEQENGGNGDDRFYEHFAELFDAASPRSNEDKALVAAYWVQIHGGHETWGSQQLNQELKNLGQGLTHIAEALSSNMNKQPKRVIQLKKSGSSQQARKTYKLTTEGIKRVRKMLDGEGGG
jgi:hypothetical protein